MLIGGVASRAIAALAREPVTADAGYDGKHLEFGRTYLIPKPFDRRLLLRVATAVAEAAVETGVAAKSLDVTAYRGKLIRLMRQE